jgi:hypothetical protein
VERWVPDAGIRVDVWGFGDILAAHPRDRRFLLVQTTTSDHTAHRLNKARARPELALWLKAGGAFELHGWTRRNGRWDVHRLTVRPDDLAGVVLVAPPRRRRRKGERQRDLFEMA